MHLEFIGEEGNNSTFCGFLIGESIYPTILFLYSRLIQNANNSKILSTYTFLVIAEALTTIIANQ